MKARDVHGKSAEEARTQTGSTKEQLIIWAVCLTLFVVLLDGVRWFNHGGFPSIASALFSLSAAPRSIDVDIAGVEFPIFIGLEAVALVLCWTLRLSPYNRLTIAVVMLSMAAAGYLLFESVGKPLLTDVLSRHGYVRCSAGDHHAGNGRGRVWFDNYVSTPSACLVRH